MPILHECIGRSSLCPITSNEQAELSAFALARILLLSDYRASPNIIGPPPRSDIPRYRTFFSLSCYRTSHSSRSLIGRAACYRTFISQFGLCALSDEYCILSDVAHNRLLCARVHASLSDGPPNSILSVLLTSNMQTYRTKKEFWNNRLSGLFPRF